MTENQLFLLSADLFDTSSNSSNLLKYDLYAFSLSSNSNSSNSLFGNALNALSSSPSPSTNNNNNNNSNNNNSDRNVYKNGGHIGSSNPMLTTAITIPRSNHSNQNYHDHHFLTDDLNGQLSPMASPHFGNQHNNMSISTSSSLLEQQQQQQLQQNRDQQDRDRQQHQHNPDQQQQQQQRFVTELCDYGLEALDASPLSPTLLQDVSLGAASPLNSSLHNITPNGHASSSSAGFYAHTTSSSFSNRAENSVVCSSDVDATTNSLADSLPLNIVGGDHGVESSPALYDEVQAQTPQSTAMWNDIGDAIITTKNEPFNLEDDYIFPIDKAEIQASFADLNDAHLLEVIGNFEEFLPITPGGAQGDYLLSPPPSSTSIQMLNSPVMSPGGPPMQLLEQHQQQQQQQQQLQTRTQQHSHHIHQPLQQSVSHHHQHHQHHQQQHQLQHQGSGRGGAVHHTHNHHGSSSPYEIYHSTPNKSQLSNSSSTAFSPGSQSSHSPLLMTSNTTPPPPHTNRSQYQQNMIKTRNMHDLLKKEFSMSPDRCSGSPIILDQFVQAGSQAQLSGTALSPGSGSSGFGSATGGGSGGSSIRKSFGYQTPDASITMRLSSSAPTHLGIENIWLRREPRQHLLSTGSLAEADSFSSLSTASVLSPDGIDLSQDDDDDGSTDYNSDHYDDFSSDGTDNEDDGRNPMQSHLSSSKSKERFFWQYNVQAKGPKGKRLVFQSKLEDPHVLNEVTDPVFSPNCSVRGIKVFKHSGKARKGDGNDLTPNPRKLHSIGKELDKLSRIINDMTPVSELPFNVRPKSRKEKNKLASRACRLKKKAQHEANKIKLFGLEIEHKRLLSGIADIKQALALKYRNRNLGESNEKIDQKIEMIYKATSAGVRIAGSTTDFVNNVLDKVKSGVPNGGLEELKNT